jgi:tetratricopeptide (TPR) repeat protein
MIEETIKKALALRQAEELRESNGLLIHLVELHPDDAYVQYQVAWSFDVLGEEAKAVPHYEQAIKLGLEEQDLQEAIIGLGSTYRTLGRYEESKKLLEDGLSQFPKNGAMKVFYAMTLYNLHENRKAMEVLLKTIAEETANDDIRSYKKAIIFYADHLDDVWE